ncbi:hypothetical protein AKJ64_01380 [candidate division MSBL1 archaeon SCGC-AAA259E17]|uniref:Uncharacterized protein n=1 Tax=candidate division MSBL1 archaeon SCGC-AAA259E17 TaxID=1698263 RepID=A0A133UFV6_9EURY|nr:hypothetical protein AKJ64_01380 [candidate division MSBL1 archaeon SCGC-AAA259E17]
MVTKIPFPSPTFCASLLTFTGDLWVLTERERANREFGGNFWKGKSVFPNVPHFSMVPRGVWRRE